MKKTSSDPKSFDKGAFAPTGKARQSFLTPLDKETMQAMTETVARRSSDGKGSIPPANRKGKLPAKPDSLGKVNSTGRKPKAGPTVVRTEVYQGESALTVEQVKELIGWKIVEYASNDKGERPERVLMKYHLRDVNGNKVFLEKNDTNRPIRPGLYKRYMHEFLRGKWKLNGDTIVQGSDGKWQQGQHRMIGFILAEEVRKKDPKKYAKYGLGGQGTKTELRYETIAVFGVSSDQDTKDTQNLGQKQTSGDVIYRRDYFEREPDPDSKSGATRMMADAKRRKLSNVLGGATRLVWMRSTNKKVSDAPHFPPSEMLDFIDSHEKLIEYVRYIYDLEVKSKGGAITKGLSLAYAAGLCYLMATSGTDPDKLKEEGLSALNYKLEKKALAFWEKFASPTNMGADDPVYNLLQVLPAIDAGSAEGRDELVGVVIKAFNAFADGAKVKEKDLQLRRMKNKDGDTVLAEDPRLGGMDTEGRAAPEEAAEDITAVEETREGSKAGKQWAEGDEAWVKSSDGEHWFGTIDEIIKHDDGALSALLTDADSGKQYQETFAEKKGKGVKDNGKLCLSFPGA